MTKKPAALSADLVAMKGAAVPAPDMPGRASSPAACPATLVTAPDVKPEDKGIAAQLPCPGVFRREFKTYAARHDLKLNELLRLSFEIYRRQNGD